MQPIQVGGLYNPDEDYVKVETGEPGISFPPHWIMIGRMTTSETPSISRSFDDGLTWETPEPLTGVTWSQVDSTRRAQVDARGAIYIGTVVLEGLGTKAVRSTAINYNDLQKSSDYLLDQGSYTSGSSSLQISRDYGITNEFLVTHPSNWMINAKFGADGKIIMQGPPPAIWVYDGSSWAQTFSYSSAGVGDQIGALDQYVAFTGGPNPRRLYTSANTGASFTQRGAVVPDNSTVIVPSPRPSGVDVGYGPRYKATPEGKAEIVPYIVFATLYRIGLTPSQRSGHFLAICSFDDNDTFRDIQIDMAPTSSAMPSRTQISILGLNPATGIIIGTAASGNSPYWRGTNYGVTSHGGTWADAGPHPYTASTGQVSAVLYIGKHYSSKVIPMVQPTSLTPGTRTSFRIHTNAGTKQVVQRRKE